MQRIYVEGQDGAAKTPFCHALVEELQKRKLNANYTAPFTAVNGLLGHDVYALWPREYERAVQLLANHIAAAQGEIVIFDRGPLTIERGLDDALNLSAKRREELMQTIPNGIHVFLDASLEKARQSKRYQSSPPPWSLEVDQRRRRELMNKYTFAFTANIESTVDLGNLAKQCADSIGYRA
jgi:thymidylate kinase